MSSKADGCGEVTQTYCRIGALAEFLQLLEGIWVPLIHAGNLVATS